MANASGTPLSMLGPITGCGPFGFMKSSVVEKCGKSDFEVDSATSARILSLAVTCNWLQRSNTRLLVTRAPVSLEDRKRGWEGKRVSVRVELGGRRQIKKQRTLQVENEQETKQT